MSARLPLTLGRGARRLLLDLIDVQTYMRDGATFDPLTEALNLEQLAELRSKLVRAGSVDYTPEELEHLHTTASAAIASSLVHTGWERAALAEAVRRIEEHT